MKIARCWNLPFILLLGVIGGCDGTISEGPLGGPNVPSVPGGPGAGDQCEDASETHIDVPVRRLTPDSFQSLLIELFGEEVPDVRGTYPEASTSSFYTNDAIALSLANEQLAESVLDAAMIIAEWAAPNLENCADDSCVRDYLTPLARTAMRRPPPPEEIEGLVELAADLRADGMNGQEAMALSLVALLQHPMVLYMSESRNDVETWELTAYERAQRLAFTFWRGAPDAYLNEAAESGTLLSPDGMRDAAQHVVDDPRVQQVFRVFLREWMDLRLSPEAHELAVRESLEAEYDRLADDIWNAEDLVASALTLTHGYVNSELEEFYGVQVGSEGPDDFVRAEIPGRFGLLTHPLVLAQAAHGEESSPIARGYLVRKQLLCTQLGTIPAGAEDLEPGGDTVRERYERRVANDVCAGCHHHLDPVGFAFENFDGHGRFRDGEDTSSEVIDAGDAEGIFADHVDMGTHFAGSERVAQCMLDHVQRFSFGRGTLGTSCGAELWNAYLEGARSGPEILQALIQTNAFVQRSTEL